MSDDRRPANKFYMECPTCGGRGVRYRSRMGASATHTPGGTRMVTGTANIQEECTDCDNGRIPLNNGEWKRKAKSPLGDSA